MTFHRSKSYNTASDAVSKPKSKKRKADEDDE
jgi:hypothetical protein